MEIKIKKVFFRKPLSIKRYEVLSLEAKGAAAAVAGRSVKGVLNVIDTGRIARIRDGGNKLPVYLAAGNLISIGIKNADNDAIGVLTGSTNIDHILRAFCKHVRIFNIVLTAFFDFITFQEIKSGGQLGYALGAQIVSVTLPDDIHRAYYNCGDNENE
jgi:hypothetical protein